jgi:hypothetical protein
MILDKKIHAQKKFWKPYHRNTLSWAFIVPMTIIMWITKKT